MGARVFAFVCLGLLLGGCVNATLEPAPEASLKPRDKKLLARAPYAKAITQRLLQSVEATAEFRQRYHSLSGWAATLI